jgi:hypothetical protein
MKTPPFLRTVGFFMVEAALRCFLEIGFSLPGTSKLMNGLSGKYSSL